MYLSYKVALIQSKSCSQAGSAEVDTRSNPHRYADGRRQLLGLSQAIREKAFQSTSPSSEAKQCNGVANSNNSKQEYHGNLVSCLLLYNCYWYRF